MVIKKAYYEELLAEYSDHYGAIALLKHHRPYLEMIPSMRRPDESVITIPLPIVRVRQPAVQSEAGIAVKGATDTLRMPCDLAILMCDPEWKIKTGVEILIYIHRPDEDFSDLLGRWRQTQILLHREYEWVMPHRYQHILNEVAEDTFPLFIVFSETPERIRKGLHGAGLPYIEQSLDVFDAEDLEMERGDRSSSLHRQSTSDSSGNTSEGGTH
ncbi:hypothetical protein ACQ4M4_20325 [Leptolyngbya sp. AN02str]|uniref:hypothetical protein n=1 Tax=Leptolyngbya sp. AN02str TaxID=3423363 RepID=UPI003D32402A